QFQLHMAEIDAAKALDCVERFRVRVADFVEPRFIVKANGIDDERLAVPPAGRIAPPGWEVKPGFWPGIREDLSESVEFLKKDDGQARVLDNLEWDGRQHRCRNAFWSATLRR